MIIVYGGTFNPPTLAHEKIANILIEKYKPEKFIFLPVGDYYTWKDDFVNFSHRKNMLELVFNEKKYTISPLENSTEFKGSYWALKEISKTYNDDVYFVIGADNVKQLDEWKNYRKLLNEFKFIVISRKGYDVNKIINEKYLTFINNFQIVTIDIDISSSEFRTNTNNISILNKEVYNYIKNNNLYGVNHA